MDFVFDRSAEGRTIKCLPSLATNPQCHYAGHPAIADGTLRLCEYSVLNKTNTDQTRVHHVETLGGILAEDDFVPVDVGPVWISELGYQPVRDVPVDGMDTGSFPPSGVVGAADADPVINNPAT